MREVVKNAFWTLLWDPKTKTYTLQSNDGEKVLRGLKEDELRALRGII